MTIKNELKIETQAAQIGLSWDTRTGAVSMPIYQSATFRHPGIGQSTGFDYGRSKNPTRQVLEDGFAAMENAHASFAFSSGLAGMTSVMLTFNSGDHFIVTEDLYGGSRRLFDKLFAPYGFTFSYVDTSDVEIVKAAITPKTRALFVESLTNLGIL